MPHDSPVKLRRSSKRMKLFGVKKKDFGSMSGEKTDITLKITTKHALIWLDPIHRQVLRFPFTTLVPFNLDHE